MFKKKIFYSNYYLFEYELKSKNKFNYQNIFIKKPFLFINFFHFKFNII